MWSLDYVQVPDEDDKPLLKEPTTPKVVKEPSKEMSVEDADVRDHGKSSNLKRTRENATLILHWKYFRMVFE